MLTDDQLLSHTYMFAKARPCTATATWHLTEPGVCLLLGALPGWCSSLTDVEGLLVLVEQFNCHSTQAWCTFAKPRLRGYHSLQPAGQVTSAVVSRLCTCTQWNLFTAGGRGASLQHPEQLLAPGPSLQHPCKHARFQPHQEAIAAAEALRTQVLPCCLQLHTNSMPCRLMPGARPRTGMLLPHGHELTAHSGVID
jgi:hypothetical protein